MYNIKDFILDNKNIGKLKVYNKKIKYTSESCSDVLIIYLNIKNNIIIDLKYQVFGCPYLLAGSNYTSNLIMNKNINYIKNLKNNEILNYFNINKENYSCFLKFLEVLKNNI